MRDMMKASRGLLFPSIVGLFCVGGRVHYTHLGFCKFVFLPLRMGSRLFPRCTLKRNVRK